MQTIETNLNENVVETAPQTIQSDIPMKKQSPLGKRDIKPVGFPTDARTGAYSG